MNPLLTSEHLIPDVEAHVMPDGRLYLYGSHDDFQAEYCSHDYRVFSTNDPDLKCWVDHGESFQNRDGEGQVAWCRGTRLYAPDAIHKNGKYYLYFCGANRCEGVAVADQPEGPFTDPTPIALADGDAIDPAIFVDDDGSAYYFWGQYELRGARLNADMRSIDETTLKRRILSEPEHGFHEGSSLRKRNGKYYLVYCDVSRGKATCLSYAVADHPLGPYKKGGVIIDNTGADPENWNNHGSIECFGGQWYVFYHRAVNKSIYMRRVCAEPIFFDENGMIGEVQMTCNGAEAPLDAFLPLPASYACRVRGGVYVSVVPSDGGASESLIGKGGHDLFLPWCEYKYLNFGEGATACRLTAKGDCTVRLFTEGGVLCGECQISSEDFSHYTFAVNNLAGTLPITLEFFGGRFELLDICFLK